MLKPMARFMARFMTWFSRWCAPLHAPLVLRARLSIMVLLLMLFTFLTTGTLFIVQVWQYSRAQIIQNNLQTLLMVRQAGEGIQEDDQRWGIWYSQLSAAALQRESKGFIMFPSGQILTTNAKTLTQLPDHMQPALAEVYAQGSAHLNDWQYLLMPDGSVIILQLPTETVQRLIRRMVFIFAVLVALALLLATAGAWWLLGFGLRPLKQMAIQAETLGQDQQLSERLLVPRPADEVRSLAESLNRMLQRIEDTMQRLRTEEARTRAFAADASHELRTPIAAIRGSLEILERTGDNPEARERLQNNLRRESKRAARLVNDLLTLTRLDAGEALHREPLDLGQLVLEIVDTARDLAPMQTIRIQSEEIPPTLELDKLRLEGVLWNLMRNAITATQATQTIQTTETAEIVVRLSHDDQKVYVSVLNPTDLPTEFVPKLFDRFSRGPNAEAGGVGLGLAIVQATIKAHGGECFARQHTDQCTDRNTDQCAQSCDQGQRLEVGFWLHKPV